MNDQGKKKLEPSSVFFILILGLFTCGVCLVLCWIFFNVFYLVLAFGIFSLFFLTALLISFPKMAFFIFIIFLLISAVFSNFVPEMVGYLTKEVLLFVVFITWFLRLLVLGKTSLENIRLGGVEVLLLLLIGFMLVQSLRHTPLTIGFFGFRSVALYAPIYFLTPSFMTTKDDVKKLMRILFLSMGVIALVGIIQYFMTAVVMEKMGFSYGEVAFRTTEGHLKSSATLGNPGAFGALIAIFLLVFISNRFTLSSNRLSGFKRLLGLGFILLLSVSLILSFSRISLIGFAVGFLILGLFFSRRTIKYYAFGLLFVLIVNALLHNFLLEYLLSSFGLVEHEQGIKSVMERISIIKMAFSKFIPSHPFFGSGLGITGAPSLRNESIVPYGYLPMDNYYLKLLLETGIIGTFLYLSFLGGCIWRGIRNFRRISDLYFRNLTLGITLGLIALSVINVASTVLEMPVVNNYFWILAGLLPALKSIDNRKT